jgi:carboxylesterase type B
MIASLQWTKHESPTLGGDPNRITVFGYSSSGATLVSMLASPSIPEDLFAQALISSGCPKLMPHFSRTMSRAVVRAVGVG